MLDGDDDYDAEDLPHWWQRWIAEAVGGLVLAAFVLAVAVIATNMPNPLKALLP